METKETDRPNSDYIHPQNHDYYAWICIDPKELDLPIPSNFPYSEGKTWRDYSTHTIDPTGLDFIHVGYRDQNGNRKERITDEEFQYWRDHFKGRNIWNVTEAKEYMEQFNPEGEDL